MAEILDLLAARDPLPPVQFPNGKRFAVRESDAYIEQLVEDASREQSQAKYREVFRYLVPDATDDDFLRFVGQDYIRLLTYCRQNIIKAMELVEANRKNASAGTPDPASDTRPSSPTAGSSTSSPASPAPSAATGPSSAPSPTGKPSSRSTRSRKPSASTTSSPTSTPSPQP